MRIGRGKLSRRQFLKSTAAAGVLLGAGGTLKFAKEAHAETNVTPELE